MTGEHDNQCKKVMLGNFDIPANTQFHLALIVVHHDTEIRGEAKILAMVEAKIVLAMIIHHFTFVVSPTYGHAPMLLL